MWENTSHLKNDYQFFDALKTKDRQIRGNCNLLTKVKFHELDWSFPLTCLFIKCSKSRFANPINHFLKARIHCEIFISDYFMKYSLMYILLHLIWFHEIDIKYVKRKPPRLRNKEFKKSLRPATLFKKRPWRRCSPVNFVKFLKASFLQNTSGRLFSKYENYFACFSRNAFIFF